MSPARIISPALVSLLALAALGASAFGQYGVSVRQSARYSRVRVGSHSNAKGPELYQIGDPATLENVWRRLGIREPIPQPFDWGANQAVILALGPRPTGGYGVSLDGIFKNGDGSATIQAVETTPARGMQVFQSLTSPYLVLAVDRSVTNFRVQWTKREAGLPAGISFLAPGSVLTSPGSTITILPPLIYGYEVYGGGYECYLGDPGLVWISNAQALAQYDQAAFGDRSYIAPRFDFRSERLLAVHLGTRQEAVSIEQVKFERQGDQAVLTLAERPPLPGATITNPKTVAPFLLVRVSREIRDVKVQWEKK